MKWLLNELRIFIFNTKRHYLEPPHYYPLMQNWKIMGETKLFHKINFSNLNAFWLQNYWNTCLLLKKANSTMKFFFMVSSITPRFIDKQITLHFSCHMLPAFKRFCIYCKVTFQSTLYEVINKFSANSFQIPKVQ